MDARISLKRDQSSGAEISWEKKNTTAGMKAVLPAVIVISPGRAAHDTGTGY